jgi:hypothetical protein
MLQAHDLGTERRVGRPGYRGCLAVEIAPYEATRGRGVPPAAR